MGGRGGGGPWLRLADRGQDRGVMGGDLRGSHHTGTGFNTVVKDVYYFSQSNSQTKNKR